MSTNWKSMAEPEPDPEPKPEKTMWPQGPPSEGEETKAPHESNKGNPPPPPKQEKEADPEFNPEAFRLSQDFSTDAGVEKVLTTIPTGKPNKQVFFRIHSDPSFTLNTRLIEDKTDHDHYLVVKSLWHHLMVESAPYTLYTGITRQNDLFILPIRLPAEDGKDNNWWASYRLATKIAESKWIRVIPNHPLNSYDVYVAKDTDRIPSPTWPAGDFGSFLKIAFRGRIIDSLDHPYLRKLRGEL